MTTSEKICWLAPRTPYSYALQQHLMLGLVRDLMGIRKDIHCYGDCFLPHQNLAKTISFKALVRHDAGR